MSDILVVGDKTYYVCGNCGDVVIIENDLVVRPNDKLRDRIQGLVAKGLIAIRMPISDLGEQ